MIHRHGWQIQRGNRIAARNYGSGMKPLPTRPLAGALVLGALVLGSLAASLTAGEPGPAMTPPPGFAATQPALAAPAAAATFADGTAHPWGPPPLPPLPGAFLWNDYAQIGPAQRYSGTYRRACPAGHACSPGRQPVLTLVSGVLDGFFSLLTFPSRKAAAHRQCAGGQCGAGSYELNPALRDWGAYPPVDPMPSYLPQPMPEQPAPGPPGLVQPAPIQPVPVQPRTDSPSSAPPTVTIDGGLPPLRSEGQPAEPQRLYPGRAPVVELAPEVHLPAEPSTLPPKNTIPKAGDRPPKNVIPGR